MLFHGSFNCNEQLITGSTSCWRKYFSFPNSDDISGSTVSRLVYNTSTTEIVTLDVTNQTKSGQKPDETLNGDVFSVGFAFEKHSSPELFLTNPPV